MTGHNQGAVEIKNVYYCLSEIPSRVGSFVADDNLTELVVKSVRSAPVLYAYEYCLVASCRSCTMVIILYSIVDQDIVSPLLKQFQLITSMCNI